VEIPSFDASCSADNTSVNTGETVTWSVTTNDSNPSYNWGGSDGLSGSDSSATISYSSAGSKTAHVIVTDSLAETHNVVCDGAVEVAEAPVDFSASCSADDTTVDVGDTVTWSVTTNDSNPSFNWSGTDDLTGSDSSASITYTSVGSKTASVVVTDSLAETHNVICDSEVAVSEAKVDDEDNSGGSGRSHRRKTTATTTPPVTATTTATSTAVVEVKEKPLFTMAQILAYMPKEEGTTTTPNDTLATNSTSTDDEGSALEGQTAGLASLFYNGDGSFSWKMLVTLILILIAILGIIWFFLIWKRDEEEEEKNKPAQK
jgi:hypothetical protein